MHWTDKLRSALEEKLNRPEWGALVREGADHIVGLVVDGTVWLAGILVLSLANFALTLVRLPPRQMELMEAIHLNTLYATILVVSAGAISRLLIATLDRLGASRGSE